MIIWIPFSLVGIEALSDVLFGCCVCSAGGGLGFLT